MKIERKKLTTALNRLKSVWDRRTTIPILKCVRVTETCDSIQLTVTDPDRTLDITVYGEVSLKDDAETCLIDPELLIKAVKNAPKTVTEIELNIKHDTSVTFTAGAMVLTFNGQIPSANWPLLPDTSHYTRKFWTIDADDLKEWLDHCAMSISNEEARYYLNGVYFDTHPRWGDEIRIVATNGHRASVHNAPRPVGMENLIECYSGYGAKKEDDVVHDGFILRRACALAWRDMIKRGEWSGKLNFVLRGPYLEVTCNAVGNWVWRTKPIDGSFPDWSRVVPLREPDYSHVVSKQDLMDVAKLAHSFDLKGVTENKSGSIRLGYHINGVHVTGIFDNDTQDRFAMTIGDPVGGELVAAAFCDRYVLEMCQTYTDAKTLRFDMWPDKTGLTKSPVVIRDTRRDDKLIVLMPAKMPRV